MDASRLEQGISQLEESQQLRPGDSQVDEALKKAKDRLADAKVKQAETFLALEEQIPVTKEKLALLRMAREQIDHALEQSPNHQEAQRTGEEIDRRMAQVHEDEGDFQEQQSAFSQPEQQAMQLSQALDHFQQASELRPNQPRLQAKQEQVEQKLAQTLDKLADKLMQSPGAQEPMEAKAARLEGAEQALNELQAIKPSDRTAQRAEQVGKELDGLRQMLAEKGQQPSESPGQGDPRNGAQPMPSPSMDGSSSGRSASSQPTRQQGTGSPKCRAKHSGLLASASSTTDTQEPVPFREEPVPARRMLGQFLDSRQSSLPEPVQWIKGTSGSKGQALNRG